MKLFRFALEILLLCGIYEIGYLVSLSLGIRIPPALFGMGIMLILLSTGIVKISFLQASHAFFNHHLILFLLPIIVGVINYGDLLKHKGFAFILVNGVSAIVVLVTTAWIMKIITGGGKGNEPYGTDDRT